MSIVLRCASYSLNDTVGVSESRSIKNISQSTAVFENKIRKLDYNVNDLMIRLKFRKSNTYENGNNLNTKFQRN